MSELTENQLNKDTRALANSGVWECGYRLGLVG